MRRKAATRRAFRVNTPADFEQAFRDLYYFDHVPLGEVVSRIFPQAADGRRFWRAHRDEFTASPGERHLLWWAYDAPIPFPPGPQELALFRAGLLTDAELAAVAGHLLSYDLTASERETISTLTEI